MQLPQYPQYKSYKPTGLRWIPEVPAHWDIERSKWLFSDRKQRAIKGEPQLAATQKYGVIPQQDFMDIEGRRITQVFLDFSILKHVEAGDFVMSMRSFQGGIEHSEYTGCVSSAYVALKPDLNCVYPNYFKYLLKTRRYIEALQSTSNLVRDGQALRFDNFSMVDLVVVPLEEQQAIARFLDDKTDKIDRAVKIKEGQIALLRERKQIIIQEAVTKGLNPDAPMKDSGIDWIGQIPAHWDMQPLRAIFGFRNERNDPVRTENILSLSIAHGVTEYTEEGRGGNKRKDDLTAYKLAYEGDIVLNSMNVIVGAVGRSKYFGAISPVYYALYPLSDSTYVPYFENIFLNAGFQRGLLRYGKGILMKLSGTGQLNTIRMKISTNDLKVLPIPIPSDEEQKALVEHIEEEASKIDAAIELKARQIEALKEYKATLINAAVTGKIKVN